MLGMFTSPLQLRRARPPVTDVAVAALRELLGVGYLLHSGGHYRLWFGVDPSKHGCLRSDIRSSQPNRSRLPSHVAINISSQRKVSCELPSYGIVVVEGDYINSVRHFPAEEDRK